MLDAVLVLEPPAPRRVSLHLVRVAVGPDSADQAGLQVVDVLGSAVHDLSLQIKVKFNQLCQPNFHVNGKKIINPSDLGIKALPERRCSYCSALGSAS